MNEEPKRLGAIPLVSPTVIFPQPCPTEASVGRVRNPVTGEVLIILQFNTMTGVQQYFFDAEGVKGYANQILDAVGAIVVVPAGGLIKP